MSDANTERKAACPKAAGLVSCKHCVEFLLDYLDGALSVEEQFRFDSHLAFCADCAVFLENYRKAASLTSGLSREERERASPAVPEELVKAILAARPKPSGAGG
jgi:anti-sigma factor RsiW